MLGDRKVLSGLGQRPRKRVSRRHSGMTCPCSSGPLDSSLTNISPSVGLTIWTTFPPPTCPGASTPRTPRAIRRRQGNLRFIHSERGNSETSRSAHVSKELFRVKGGISDDRRFYRARHARLLPRDENCAWRVRRHHALQEFGEQEDGGGVSGQRHSVAGAQAHSVEPAWPETKAVIENVRTTCERVASSRARRFEERRAEAHLNIGPAISITSEMAEEVPDRRPIIARRHDSRRWTLSQPLSRQVHEIEHTIAHHGSWTAGRRCAAQSFRVGQWRNSSRTSCNRWPHPLRRRVCGQSELGHEAATNRQPRRQGDPSPRTSAYPRRHQQADATSVEAAARLAPRMACLSGR